MTFKEIVTTLQGHFPAEAIVRLEDTLAQPAIVLHKGALNKMCRYLFETKGLYFDSLSCLTVVDNGVQKNSLEVLYHLYSIPYAHSLVLKVFLPRAYSEAAQTEFVSFEDQWLPTIDSVTDVWRTANWHEREAFDLSGVYFENHPDLRRILMPADWKGHPLRKDYQNLETYHGIKVAY